MRVKANGTMDPEQQLQLLTIIFKQLSKLEFSVREIL